MHKYGRGSKVWMWFIALLVAGFVAGCGSGDKIFGGGVTSGSSTIPGAPAGAIVPGATCTASAGATIPTVTASDPTSGNQFATTSTTGVAGGGKVITASFSLAMAPATINATTFTLTPVGGTALVPASVTYSANMATLTTSSALSANTSYTGIVTTTVTSAAGIPLACIYAWNFKTRAAAAAGLAPVNLGLASSTGIAATAGVTNTGATTINGNVVLDPTTTCNAVQIPPNSAGTPGTFGACGVGGPTLNGVVISSIFNQGVTSTSIKNDLLAAFLSITPPAGPPAAGSRGGPTAIAAGTTLGEPTGSALVQGDNLFAPGLYQSVTSILITGDLTLDGQGDSNALFIFQSSSTVGTATGARILLVNGARASNVWWQAGTSATLGVNSIFQGNILASADITMVTGATSCGRLLAGAFTAGAFVFDSNVVSVPGNSNAPASCQ